MTLSVGTVLGPYEIVAPIGRGGMGEVFEARDRRLDRRVAIKILPPSLATDAACRQRFEREARAIAALSHPHICTLYDIGHDQDVDFLVMEYLDGETLNERLARQRTGRSATDGTIAREPLSIDETFRIATQLADAIAAAHRLGIVHRDLKPGNVMLTRGGVKVLDFGLAKVETSGLGTDASVARAETISANPLTEQGTILGTLPYMAPEQLEGRGADARTDIFAFGAVVYEMATGRRAFTGVSQASVIAAILERTPPPIADSQPQAPAALERLVAKCLAKNPDSRWQSAIDLADELRWLSSNSVVAAPSATRRSVGSTRVSTRWWVAGVLTVTGITGAYWSLPRTTQNPAPLGAVHRQATFDGDVLHAAVSPDAHTVAYSTGEEEHNVRLYVRDLRGGQPLELWRGESLWELKWLPDGSHLLIAGRESGQLRTWLIPRLGGPTRVLDVPGGMMALSPMATHVAVAAGQGSHEVSIIPMSSGERRTVSVPGIRTLWALEWSRTTDTIVILTTGTEGESIVWTVRSDGQELRRLYSQREAIQAVCTSPVSDVVYAFSGQRLIRLPLTNHNSAIPETLGSGWPQSGPRCTVSADGSKLAQLRRSTEAMLWQLRESSAPILPLTSGTFLYSAPSLSPDRQHVVATQWPSGDIMKISLASGEATPVGQGDVPTWSPDGTRLAFVSRGDGTPRVWTSDTSGLRRSEVRDATLTNALVTWLPDGRLAWQTLDARNYRIRNLATGEDELLMKGDSPGFVFNPQFSPNMDRVVFFWNRAEGRALWVLSWPAREGRLLMAGSVYPDGWSADGEWVYAHRADSAAVFKVAVRDGHAEPVATFPRGVLGGTPCTLSPNLFPLVCRLTEAKTDVWLIENFDPHVQPSR